VRAFRVHEGDGLPHRNREFAGCENEVSQVDSGVCFALSLCKSRVQAGEYEKEGEVFHLFWFHGIYSLHMPIVTALDIYLPYIGMNNNKLVVGFDWDGVPVAFHPCA